MVYSFIHTSIHQFIQPSIHSSPDSFIKGLAHPWNSEFCLWQVWIAYFISVFGHYSINMALFSWNWWSWIINNQVEQYRNQRHHLKEWLSFHNTSEGTNKNRGTWGIFQGGLWSLKILPHGLLMPVHQKKWTHAGPSMRGLWFQDSAGAENALGEKSRSSEAPEELLELPLVLKFQILNSENHMYWGQKNCVPCELYDDVSQPRSPVQPPPPTDEELEAQRREKAYPRSHSMLVLHPLTPQCTFISMIGASHL